MSWFCTFSMPFFCFKLHLFHLTIFSLFLVWELKFENCKVNVKMFYLLKKWKLCVLVWITKKKKWWDLLFHHYYRIILMLIIIEYSSEYPLTWMQVMKRKIIQRRKQVKEKEEKINRIKSWPLQKITNNIFYISFNVFHLLTFHLQLLPTCLLISRDFQLPNFSNYNRCCCSCSYCCF